MLTGTGEYRGGQAGGYSRVHITCEAEDSSLRISIALDDHEWNDQLRDGSFSDWTDAAVSGCRFALQAASRVTGQWYIHRIVGLLADTTTEFVAIASARAAWSATQYTATTEDEQSLRAFAQSMNRKADS